MKLKRKLEQMMLRVGSSYDQGRIGTEIAFLCETNFLLLRNLVIEEPSKGGKDLYTFDRKVIMQARMIRDLPTKKLDDYIRSELLSLVRKLQQDFAYNPRARTGYALLSFLNANDTIKVLILQVPNARK